MHVPGIRGAVLVGLIVVAALLFAAGVAWAVAWVTHSTSSHAQVLPARGNLQVTSTHSDVKVVAADGPKLRLITEERRSIFGTPHAHVGYADGRLRLDSDCGGAEVLANECSASFVLEVPRAMAVHVAASSGDVHVDSPARDIDVATSSGDVHVHATDPALVRVRARSGDVHVDVPDRTYAVRARVTSGDKHVDVREDASAPRKLDVGATSGDVHIASDG